MSIIVSEKVEQAIGILAETDIDCWITFVRETTETGDPVLPLILGQPLTWQSALIITPGGRRIAIVGKYEDEAVRSTGVWSEIVTYVQGIAEPLRDTLCAINPQRIAVNYSLNDVKADGLSHGMFQLLLEHLEGTPYGTRLVSAETIIARLRGRKTPSEIDRMRQAISTTDDIFRLVTEYARSGRTELEIATFMHNEVKQRGLTTSWEEAMCPIVTTGPDSMVGHGLPSPDLSIRPGNIFHLDFGVCENEYCSDIQRSWYVPSDADPTPGSELRRAFDAVLGAIRAASHVLRPGVAGWEVDTAARSTLIEHGYDEYQHATGHHVGRAAHDGGTVLGPRWERYGQTPYYEVEAGNVFTLELGIDTPQGYLGLEEMVLVTEDGFEWLSTPQEELLILE